jgi:hypothetical protein
VLRLERAGGIVQAGMNHAAVTGTGPHRELRQRFKQENVTPARRDGACDGAPYDTAANDYDVCPVDGWVLSRYSTKSNSGVHCTGIDLGSRREFKYFAKFWLR